MNEPKLRTFTAEGSDAYGNKLFTVAAFCGTVEQTEQQLELLSVLTRKYTDVLVQLPVFQTPEDDLALELEKFIPEESLDPSDYHRILLVEFEDRKNPQSGEIAEEAAAHFQSGYIMLGE